MANAVGSPRRGMTLVEVLVSVAVILVVLAIVIPSVHSYRAAAAEVQIREEIHQMVMAMETFKLKYGRYPPNKIKLRECGGYDQPLDVLDSRDGLDGFSAEYLRALFKGIDLDLNLTSRGTMWHDWNGNGQPDAQPVVLEGDECLVLFLGGIPQRDVSGKTVALTGFNPDRARPAAPTLPVVVREGPFYEFDGRRLAWPWEERSRPNYVPIYLDHFGTPYLYFRVTKNQCIFV
jgi:prepilin-type N-terminal cleavage/methylation domain-containing protein